MGLFDGAARQGRGSLLGLIANAAFLMAITCVATGMLLDRLTTGPEAPLLALLAPNPAPIRDQLARADLRRTTDPALDQVDTMPTASLKRPLIINPCAATPK